ncbi:MAG: nucleotidyltransferase domain-containing protein [Candidatus Altiarchaeota archaeon]
MEQILSFEVVDALIKDEIHPRLLSKRLAVNHMSVNRRLKELRKANVVDFHENGKNKTYFLKRTVEARCYVYMAEHHKLLKIVEGYPHLRKVVERIQEDQRIGMAVIFGSHAKNAATDDSDIDIYVETKDRKIKAGLEALDSRLSVKIGTYDRSNPLVKEIEKNHVIIKGVEEYYGKTGLFG